MSGVFFGCVQKLRRREFVVCVCVVEMLFILCS